MLQIRAPVECEAEGMAMVSTKTKAKAGVKGTQVVARHPMIRRGTVKAGWTAGKYVAKRKAQSQYERLGPVAQAIGETVMVVAVVWPQIAQELGLVETPKRRSAVPAVAAGVVIGAGAVYFLPVPGRGSEG
jgi:hypothetical protein